MHIEFQWFDDCPNHTHARELLHEVLTERGIDAEVEDIAVNDVETAERVRFAGSPTIRIDGLDIEPDFVDSGDYTPRCRLYATANGLRGLPERGWIEAALDGAVVAS